MGPSIKYTGIFLAFSDMFFNFKTVHNFNGDILQIIPEINYRSSRLSVSVKSIFARAGCFNTTHWTKSY